MSFQQRNDGQNEERNADLHLLLSQKYMAYKDLAERCQINQDQVEKGEKRVFYMKPKSPFLQEPRVQNQFRNEFVRQIGQPPNPEPLTYMADDLQKAYNEIAMDQSNPAIVKDELAKFFRQRQYKLQHKRYKLLLRWAHNCLTSEAVDRSAMKFNPIYSKIQFELENAVKRYTRLDGDDHFLTPDRPQQKAGSSYADDGVRPPLSALRSDDIDVYLRIVSYETRITRQIEAFIQRTKWAQLQFRFDIYEDSVKYFQSLREQAVQLQKDFLTQIKAKGEQLIDIKKLGDEGHKELNQIIQSKTISKLEKKIINMRDQIFSTAKYNYETPPKAYWNEVELKIKLQQLTEQFKVQADMEVDNGHSFSYAVIVFFPQHFQHQVILNQFAPYDAIPSLIDPANLAKQNIKKVLRRNQKKYGRTQGANTLLEVLEIQKHSKEMGVEFLNSVEKSLFGEFNNSQLPDFPTIRIKKADWVDLICFKAQLDNEQMHQASVLFSDKNWIDECLANMLEILNVQDVQNVNLIMESISQIHYDKVKYGSVKTDFLNFDPNEPDTFFTEDQKSFLSLFKACFKAKADFDQSKQSVELATTSIHEIPQHLLFANYLLQCLNAREQKTKLLYTLNTFRAIQRRITLEMREMGTRDRVLGDAYLVKPMEHRAETPKTEDEDDTDGAGSTPGSGPDFLGQIQDNGEGKEKIDITKDSLVDINKYRFNKKLQNFLHSTCPLVPKFHATFGQPIERQEISQEIDNAKNTDSKKQESKKLLGRIDKIYKHEKSGLNLVKDDFGVHILYDASLADMRVMEQEILKICSFYLNKAEPLLDNDLRNTYPAVDRLQIMDDLITFENQYQEEKLKLVQAYLECYEHTSDCLEQQRLVQIIVDEMAKRPKLNLSATYFRDSYQAEIEAMKLKTRLIREAMRILMHTETNENTKIREYIEKCYRLLYDQMNKKWNYVGPEKVEEELNRREMIQTEDGGTRNAKNDLLLESEGGETYKKPVDEIELEFRKNKAKELAERIESNTFSDARDFASKLGIPYADLEILLKDHHERDHLVRQSLHEHVAFIKTSEGYPQFIFQNAMPTTKFKFCPDSKQIGILDFYESLHIMPRFVSVIQYTINELLEVHKPDNGLLSTCLEISTYKHLMDDLKLSADESPSNLKSKGKFYLEDSSIVGNPDKMLFYVKELAICGKDPNVAQNPFVMGKLDKEALETFDFSVYQGYIDTGDQYSGVETGGKDKQLDEEFNLQRATKRNFSYIYPKLREKTKGIEMPTMLTLACNTVEVNRLRTTLISIIEQTLVLEQVYNRQTKVMGKEGSIYFKDQFNFVNYVAHGGENFVNFIEEGPGNEIEVKLAINEYDTRLRSCINFSDPECFKALVLPMGLEELRVVVQYEVMNLQTLIVATQINQILLDNQERKLKEIEFFRLGFTVANPVFNLWEKLQGQNMFESNLKKLPNLEKSATNSKIKSSVAEGYFNIITKKQKMKDTAEKVFKQIKNQTVALKDQKIEITQRQLRTLKIVMCYDYCQDLLARIYIDSIKLQVLKETDRLRKRIYLLPRESIFLELFPPNYGEHQFAAYNEDHMEGNAASRDQQLFFNQHDNRIYNFWRLPSNLEVLNVNVELDNFKQMNMPKNFNYDMGLPAEDRPSEFFRGNSLMKIREKLPSVTYTDSRDVDHVVKEKGRLVEFAEAFNYSSGGRIVSYLSYFKSISNIFDIEFFTNKLASTANSIANIERMVLSGVPFLEEGDDSLLGDIDEGSDSDDSTAKKGRTDENKFDEEGHKPLKNVLATQVAEKIAKEKTQKLQLLQDLESIKDRFMDFEVIMKKQEMSGSLSRASQFLNEIQQISYYGVLFILYQMQDNYYKDAKGQKEIQFINEIIQNLSHQQDLKVSYLNGFHVNYAVTSTSRINLDSSFLKPDYDSFFKATQPVIDEAAINPPEFNLISGIYLINSLNLITFKKNIPFMGSFLPRDYGCLDYALTNISKNLRNDIMSNLHSNDLTLQSFIKAKMKLDEKDYQSNPTVYTQILQEKKSYLKVQIKARQSRRIMMIVMNKQLLPTDVQEYNEVLNDYNEQMRRKIDKYVDGIAHNRAIVAEREMANQRKKSRDGGQVVKSFKESPVLKTYDQATSEIEVIHNELQKHMINTAFDMFEKETNSLAKTFEMNNVKLQAFVHPSQQFASTFHQMVDNRNHLDIINKVGPIQKMLTQIKNRCLEIQTLTSGVGVVISSKDLNECLEECCRSLIKYGEIEMRTRCEHLAMTLVQYENLLYVKDRQLLNLETKLRTAKQEMNKIVNTKVFSRGNNLIYELDMTTRQLRLLKDNIFLLEKNLTEKIKLCYDRELDQARMQLADFRRQFYEYQENVSQRIKAGVREEVNSIDGIMKMKANHYKDLSLQTQKQQKFEEYKSKQININNTTLNIDNLVINKDGTVGQTGANDPRMLEELETLKMNEKEARDEVLRLQDIIRKYRIMNKFKEVLTSERHQYKIDNLKQQLTSNTTLWEQLAEGEKREKILKQEIERAQQEIATQEKIIERLKDDIKKEGREKQKLLQYKNTKSKRLEELETKAREFEVLSSVNLGKILSLLESKERKIGSLSKTHENMDDYVRAMSQINQQEMMKVKQKAKEETKFKMEAMTKLEGLRQELQMIQGNDQVSVNFWKEQCQSLFEICKNLKEDNEKLVDNLGKLSDTAMMSLDGGLRHQFDPNVHPLDQFQNNQDLLNYLNSTPMTGQKRGNSQQVNSQLYNSNYSNTQQFNKDDLDRAMFGMSKGLKDHMLGQGRNRVGGSMAPALGRSSESKEYGFQLPNIQMNQSRQYDPQIGLKNKLIFPQGQPNPFMGKLPPGFEHDSINSSVQGKLKPIYDKNKKFRKDDLFSGGKIDANVFRRNVNPQQSLTQQSIEHVIGSHNTSIVKPGSDIINTSVDHTTMMQSSVNHGYQGSPSPNQFGNIHATGSQSLENSLGPSAQSKMPPGLSSSLAAEGTNQNAFQQYISASGANTQRGPEQNNFESQQKVIMEQQHLLTNRDEYQSKEEQMKGQKRAGGAKKRMDEKPKNILQPRLVDPPSKLAKTLEYQGAKASHMPKKQQAQPQ